MTVSRHQELLDLLPAYALGALEAEDARVLEEHLEQGCSECESELAVWSGQVEGLAETVEPVALSDEARARVLEALPTQTVATESSASAEDPAGPSQEKSLGSDERLAESNHPATNRFWPLALAASIVLLALSGSVLFSLRNEVQQLGDRNAHLASELESVQRELGSTQTKLEVMAAAHRIIVSPAASSVRLAGLEAAPDAFGVTFVDPQTERAVFYATELANVEQDQTYQLWFIADGQPVSGGVFEVDEQGQATLLVENVDGPIDNWAVTVEPAGGVPAPTGTMVLLG